MSKGENLTKRYKDYAIYLPSLQKQYASYAKKNRKDIRGGNLPNGFKISDLDFLNPNSQLWSCGYVLYSAGQFDKSQIRDRDIVAERKPGQSIVVGDSGGFQLGTGSISNNKESALLNEHANNPAKQYANWSNVGFRERTLRWLDKYTDYAMTLDMVLWASESYGEPRAKNSQLRKLSIQQLIDLSVDNLKFFDENRGKSSGRQTKFLNVLQDIGNGTGEAWYQAVKDFDFEGWALGSETGSYLNSLQWMRRLLDDYKLDKSEWIHTLMKSPPINSVVYTAAQRALSKAAGRKITVSYDSSSPHQTAGINRALSIKPTLTNDLNSWKISNEEIEQNLQLAKRETLKPIPISSPLSKFFDLNDFNFHTDLYADNFLDPFAYQLLTNHNLYTYHVAALEACELVFDEKKQNLGMVPTQIQDVLGFIDEYFETENPATLVEKNSALFKLI